MTSPDYILTIRCRDTIGIVAAVSTALAASQAFIAESSHFGDPETRLFFMRTVFRPTGEVVRTLEDFRKALAPVARRFGMELALYAADSRTRVLLAVSKHGHCLNHLLHQWHSGELPLDVVGVVSNHEDMRRLVEWYGLPYHYLPMSDGKDRQESRFREAIASSGAELTVLARYMQVLSDEMCRHLEGRCINIHHSFLPSFKGAKPYHQAYARGVKVVGATAHYVTSDLDEGPIIEQETHRVSHAFDADAFVRNGKDMENVVLSRAVRWHAEHRVMLNGSRTVVFQ
ncbi:formyltetrahydrofolate deformylase [Roseateles violae]|uniref:Formyltetrahydrofolate deformylase n=1 Tax=Roseateles violae TaxID=3058042 RepID=A0ABT8DY67_9BURK|nr:formyltetrahydrofolate deformylase [Pelomonas sp. PFR6]MDN3922154.1 formyltetrahydrofolate deformylase [Pelomonas sp. PFR6]